MLQHTSPLENSSDKIPSYSYEGMLLVLCGRAIN